MAGRRPPHSPSTSPSPIGKPFWSRPGPESIAGYSCDSTCPSDAHIGSAPKRPEPSNSSRRIVVLEGPIHEVGHGLEAVARVPRRAVGFTVYMFDSAQVIQQPARVGEIRTASGTWEHPTHLRAPAVQRPGRGGGFLDRPERSGRKVAPAGSGRGMRDSASRFSVVSAGIVLPRRASSLGPHLVRSVHLRPRPLLSRSRGLLVDGQPDERITGLAALNHFSKQSCHYLVFSFPALGL